MLNKVRFGVIAVQNATWETLAKRWQYIEKMGFDTLWIADHFTVPYKDYRHMTWYEAWTTLSGLAAITSQIRIGTLVTAIPWRNPAWLARQAITIDHISNGRLELGIGAGGHGDSGHSMTGVKDWTNTQRVKRFREYVEVLDLLLREPLASYDGRYYKIKEAHMQPQSIQKPRPPITIGAYKPMMLKHTARYADVWNRIGGLSGPEIDEVRNQNKLLDRYCKKIDRAPESLRRSYVLCEFDAMRNLGPMSIYESTDTFKESVEKCFDAGITEFILPYPNVQEQVPTYKKVAREVIPELRKQYSN